MFKDKKIVITGAAGGLGEEFVSQLHALGANIYSIVSPKSDISKISQYCKHVFRCDLSSQEEVQLFLKSDLFNDVDILINCAGLFYLKLLTQITAEDYNSMMNVNVYSPLALSLRCSKSMKSKGSGLIINIGSSSCYNGCCDTAVYSISKHALLGMSRSLSKAFKDYNIRVLIFCPGSIKTKMGQLDERQDFNSFLEPNKIVEYIIYTASLSNNIIIDESRLNRLSVL